MNLKRFTSLFICYFFIHKLSFFSFFFWEAKSNGFTFVDFCYKSFVDFFYYLNVFFFLVIYYLNVNVGHVGRYYQ